MKIILDIDCYDDEYFELFKACLEERKEILKSIKQLEEGKLNEFELSCYMRGVKHDVTVYLSKERFEKNKDFVKKALELMLETNERDTKNIIERLGIEYYEGVEE